MENRKFLMVDLRNSKFAEKLRILGTFEEHVPDADA